MPDAYGVPLPSCPEDYQDLLLGMFDLIEHARDNEKFISVIMLSNKR